jgi:RNA polymerase sigma-70 factor (ECF subfamily)
MPTSEQLALVQGLFIQHLPTLRGFVLALVGSFDLVDDVVQETFITVNANASAFQPGTNFRAWVCTIARFKALQALDSRARKDIERLSPEVVEALCAHETAEDWCTEQQLRLLSSCLEKLAPQAHRMVELRYQHAQRPPEIARLMGWTVNAVHVALSRSRVFLRDCMKRRMNAENANYGC